MIPEKRNSLFRRLVFVLNLFAVLFLFTSYLAYYVSPEGNFWWLQVFGFAYGIIALVNLTFVVFWVLMRDRKFWFSLIALMIGYNRIFGIIEPRISSGEVPPKDSVQAYPFKIMSFNVRLFDLYNWFHNTQTKSNIFRFLKEESPDVICFQEYYTSERKHFGYNNNAELPRLLKSRDSFVEYTVTLRDSDHWGGAIYSRYPIVNRHAVHFNERGGNIFMYADIKVGEDTLRVFNTHLESVRFKSEDYKYFENLRKDIDQDEVAGGKKILGRLKVAFAKRAIQVEQVKKEIERSPYPVIVCGDFNDTPSSYTYHMLAEGLKDAFRESGRGLGKTYAGLFPSFRIDYILHDKKIESVKYTTHREKLSDHFAISCWMHRESR